MITPVIILLILTLPVFTELVMTRIQQRSIRLESAALTGLVLAFAFFALGHFVKTEGLVAMLPGWIPFRSGLVYVTCTWEIVIATGLILKPYRRAALLASIVTLIVFFSVNVHAAINFTGLGGHQWGPVYLLIRGPLQVTLIGYCAWAYWLTVRHSRN